MLSAAWVAAWVVKRDVAEDAAWVAEWAVGTVAWAMGDAEWTVRAVRAASAASANEKAYQKRIFRKYFCKKDEPKAKEL